MCGNLQNHVINMWIDFSAIIEQFTVENEKNQLGKNWILNYNTLRKENQFSIIFGIFENFYSKFYPTAYELVSQIPSRILSKVKGNHFTSEFDLSATISIFRQPFRHYFFTIFQARINLYFPSFKLQNQFLGCNFLFLQKFDDSHFFIQS